MKCETASPGAFRENRHTLSFQIAWAPNGDTAETRC